MKNNIFKLLVFLLLLSSCKTYLPTKSFSNLSEDPNYSKLETWAAHPNKDDNADRTPEKISLEKNLTADVFFLYPTIYYGDHKSEQNWNAPVNDERFNKKVDDSAILFQASAFNHGGNVYAPRYRQAHLNAYWNKDRESARQAFDLAYKDVKSAFEFYLANFNNSKPIIIAGHSQGTDHAKRLLKDFFDGKDLQSQLVAAYLIGMPVNKNNFTTILPCQNKDDIGCFVSWRTFKKGVESSTSEGEIVVTNPLSWKLNNEYIPKSKNPGSVLRDFNKIYPEIVDAQIYKNILWATKPKFPGSIFFTRKNYHIADINFYYLSIRNNTVEKVKSFLNKNNEKK
jgi:hypothetical protein